MPRKSATKTPPAPQPRTSTTDLLGCLGERGWHPVDGGGWKHPDRDLTVRQGSPNRYTVTYDGRDRELTSATGVLVVIDAIERADT